MLEIPVPLKDHECPHAQTDVCLPLQERKKYLPAPLKPPSVIPAFLPGGGAQFPVPAAYEYLKTQRPEVEIDMATEFAPIEKAVRAYNKDQKDAEPEKKTDKKTHVTENKKYEEKKEHHGKTKNRKKRKETHK
jgi:hypothetical protein